jgi:glycosyltransferase involved in cell wall biosynthesis
LKLPEQIIVCIEGSGPDGGAERVALDSVVWLAKNGFRVHIITTADHLQEPYASLDAVTYDCLDVPLFWNRFFGSGKFRMVRTLFNDPEMYAKFREILLRFDPSRCLVHFHQFYASLSTSSVDAALNLGFRTVLTCHDYGYVCPNATLYDYKKGCICPESPLSVGCMKSNCLGDDAVRIKAVRFSRLWALHKLHRADKRVAGLICVSNFAANIIRKCVPPATKIVVVKNPVNPASTEKQQPSSAACYSWIARMTDEKAPKIAAQAAERAGVRMTFAGTGPSLDSLRQAYPDMEYLGWLDGSATSKLQRNSRALIMTSAWYETASLVVLETLAAGVPVVIPNRTAATDWVTDGQNGLIFESGNAESLADKIDMLKDDSLVERLGAAAFERYWSAPFTSESHGESLVAAYEQFWGSRT